MSNIAELEYRKRVCEIELDNAEKILYKANLFKKSSFAITRFEAEVYIYLTALEVINKELAEALEKT